MRVAFSIMAPWAIVACVIGYKYGLGAGMLFYFIGGMAWCLALYYYTVAVLLHKQEK